MHPAKFKNHVTYTRLARSGALAGPGYDFAPLLGAKITHKHPLLTDEQRRRVQIASLWVPHGMRVEDASWDNGAAWYTDVDIYDLKSWSICANVDYNVLYERFRTAIRYRHGGAANLADILTTPDLYAMNVRRVIWFNTEVYPHAREINFYRTHTIDL